MDKIMCPDCKGRGASLDGNDICPRCIATGKIDPPWTIQTRKEAVAARNAKYYTGKNCKHGHVSRRYAANGMCCKCNTVNVHNYHARHQFDKTHLERINITVHKDDAPTIKAIIDNMNKARGLL